MQYRNLCACATSIASYVEVVSNEGHFNLEAEIFFCPYLPSHWSGVSDIYHIELPMLALSAVQGRLK
jgi:hypothetical protein